MAKVRSEYVCRECGYRAPRPLGRCPECDAWSSLDELTRATLPSVAPRPASGPVRLADIHRHDFDRIQVPMAEFARVLGGGIVSGSLVLIGGDPGVGKSTLLTQVANLVASQGESVLYVSGED